jgi:hypothetical protein
MKTIFRLALSLVMLTCVNVTISAQNTASGCYRGFVDAGYTIGVGDYDFGRFEVNTTHGYQINPYFFVGAGVGMHFMPSYKTSGMSDIPLDTRDSKVDIPVFAAARGTFMKSRFAPFIDVKGGTYVNNNGGLYYNISAGLRIAVNEKQAVDISVGYTNEKLEFQTFSHFISDRSLDYTRMPEKYDTEGIAIKIGYEF